MPGLDRGEYDIAAGDLRTPQGPSSVPCSASGMAAATCLIASGTHFAIPRLNGIPPRHQMSFGVQPAARLGLSLLEAGIADPSDWLRDNDAIEFIEKTLRRWALKNGGEEISTEFDLALALVSDLEPYAESPNAAIAQDMYIVLEPETAGYVVLGPVDRVETLREWYEGDPEGEQVELPDVKGATPQFLRHRKPLQESFVVKLAERARDKRLREILRGVLQLSATSRRAQRPEIGPEASDRLADSNPPLPALLAVFEKQDAIEGCFDEESQGMMECPPEPNVIIPLKIADVDGVKTAFGIAEVVCDVLTQASRLIKLIMANVN